jgi:hypothetical protein
VQRFHDRERGVLVRLVEALVKTSLPSGGQIPWKSACKMA